MSYRAVLFDLDGTLLDTIDDLAGSMNAALSALGFPAHPAESYKLFVGDGIETMARRALPEGRRGAETVRSLVAATRVDYRRNFADRTRPYPGIPELLDELAVRGLRTAVLSNKPDDFTRLCVERLLPGRSFDAVRGAREGAPVKPDPAGALAVARGLGIAPGKFLYLGDTNTDMLTAVAAGMFPVGALWGFRTREELASSGAGALVAEPREVLALLG